MLSKCNINKKKNNTCSDNNAKSQRFIIVVILNQSESIIQYKIELRTHW